MIKPANKDIGIKLTAHYTEVIGFYFVVIGLPLIIIGLLYKYYD